MISRTDFLPKTHTVLVRYGAIPEVARFQSPLPGELPRGAAVVVQSHRGMEVGTMLEQVRTPPPNPSSSADFNPRESPDGSASSAEFNPSDDFQVLRLATDEDRSRVEELRQECEQSFDLWRRRIRDWNLQLELIDLEWTLDRGKLILYVLNDRGPDCTKLALQAAAAGLGVIEVQPVDSGGLMKVASAGGGCGCGSGGGGCGVSSGE